MVSKIDRRVEKIYERIGEIEAAIDDLSFASLPPIRVRDIESRGIVLRKYKNRLLSVFLLLYHLRDDVRRLAKAKAIKPSDVDEFTDRSICIKLCIRAGDTHKHGLGGHSRNGTLLESFNYVVETRPDEDINPESKVILVGMNIVDADHGMFPSGEVIERALIDWHDYLIKTFDVDISESVNRCIPEKGKIVPLQKEGITEVSLGSTIAFELPKEMRDAAQMRVIKRRDDS